MKWSEESVKQLKSLASAGVSNPDIAKKLGVKVTDVYAKRSQLGITIDKVKSAGKVNPELEAALPTPMPKRFQERRELDRKHDVLDLLAPALGKADSSIVALELVDHGQAVKIHYSDGAQRRACIECDSLLAVIADVTHKCLY